MPAHIVGDLTVTTATSQEFDAAMNAAASNPALVVVASDPVALTISLHMDNQPA
jgi:hypothetical protein